jgi:dCTP deaminase
LILSKLEIQKYLANGELVIDPPPDANDIEQVSIDLYLGRYFTTFKECPLYLPEIILDPSVFQSLDLWEEHEGDSFVLNPGQFVLAHTLQRVHLPNNLMGFIEGRSSLARLGITIHLTAPKIDPGFNGTITLEMAHFGKVPVRLRAGIDKPAQLILMNAAPLSDDQVYGSKESHLFQGQSTPLPKK